VEDERERTDLLDDPERIRIISLNGVRSDRDEDGKNVLKDESWDESSEGGDKEKTLLEGLRVSAVCGRGRGWKSASSSVESLAICFSFN